MMTALVGRERTQSEYIDLLTKAGFSDIQVKVNEKYTNAILAITK